MAYTFPLQSGGPSAFLTTARINTLPVYLYGSLQYGPSPAVYAAAAAVFLFTMLLLGLVVFGLLGHAAPGCSLESLTHVAALLQAPP